MFRCCCVSPEWRARWSAEHLFLPRFALDVSTFTVCARDLAALARRISPRCAYLDLNLSSSSFGEDGVRTLVERLPAGLTRLALSFAGCKIGEAGARHLAEFLPPGLSNLTLDLQECEIGEGGARALAERLPQRLSSLSLNFSGFNIGERGAHAVAESLPQILSSLATITVYSTLTKFARIKVYMAVGYQWFNELIVANTL